VDAIGDSGQRIGATERDEAVESLRTHLDEGRLTPEEYEDRSVTAARARTWDDLAPVFADLPEPRPAPVATVLARSAQPVPRTGLAGITDAARERIMALIPLLALVLFFRTGSWLWFLAIPMAGALLYGKDRKRRD